MNNERDGFFFHLFIIIIFNFILQYLLDFELLFINDFGLLLIGLSQFQTNI